MSGSVFVEAGGNLHPADFIPAGCHQYIPAGWARVAQYPGGTANIQHETTAILQKYYPLAWLDDESIRVGRFVEDKSPLVSLDARAIVSIANLGTAALTITEYPRSTGAPITIQPSEAWLFYAESTEPVTGIPSGYPDLTVTFGVPAPLVPFYGVIE